MAWPPALRCWKPRPACILCAGSWWLGWLDRPLPMLWTIAGGLWVLGGAWLLRIGVAGWPRIPQPVRLVIGVLVLWLAWLAVAQARVIGINFLLSVLVLVWVADIFAYVAGRTFGLKFTKSKLAPTISPGKSWEGVWGGMAGVLVLAAAWAALDAALQAPVASLYTRLASRGICLAGDRRGLSGCDERGGRPGRIADQAQRRREGFQPAAARPRRRARPRRCVVAHLAAGADARQPHGPMRQRITVLGSTGSVGANTLDVIARHPERFEVFALSAASQVDLMLQQCAQFSPRFAVMAAEAPGRELARKVKAAGLATAGAMGPAGPGRSGRP